MKQTLVIFRRELRSYFATPLAYVFIVIFLVLAAVFTFQVGGLFERGQADLQPFFRWHPWLYLVLIPAISMRLWAEERNSGSIELLMTLPVTLRQAVAGKFLAAWCFAGVALHLPVREERDRPVNLLAAQREVVVDGQFVDQGKVLVNGVDAFRACVVDAFWGVRLTVQEHLARVLPLKAAEDLDQSRLAGPVVAEQAQHLALAQVQVDVAQGGHRPEALGDVLDAQHVVRS